MERLYFKYGTVNSFLTTKALILRFNYIEKKKNPVLLKHRINRNDNDRTIKSRIGIKAEGVFVDEFLREINTSGSETQEGLKDHRYQIIIVDRAHLLTEDQVDLISDIVDSYDVPVVCYGLRSDYDGKLYEGSKRLMEIADVIEEVPTVCWCGAQASFNCRLINGKIVRGDAELMIGATEEFVSLCRKHFKEKRIQ